MKKGFVLIFFVFLTQTIAFGAVEETPKKYHIFLTVYKNGTPGSISVGIFLGEPVYKEPIISNYIAKLVSENGTVIATRRIYITFLLLSDPPVEIDPGEGTFEINYFKDARYLIIERNETQLFKKELPFCNQNDICDIGESYLNCPQDCQTGYGDGYCDGFNDGRCDPDCIYVCTTPWRSEGTVCEHGDKIDCNKSNVVCYYEGDIKCLYPDNPEKWPPVEPQHPFYEPKPWLAVIGAGGLIIFILFIFYFLRRKALQKIKKKKSRRK
jgi:hypothetical protein